MPEDDDGLTQYEKTLNETLPLTKDLLKLYVGMPYTNIVVHVALVSRSRFCKQGARTVEKVI